MKLISFFLTIILLAGTLGYSDWDYLPTLGHIDPTKWYTKYKLCNGQRQSPVSIDYRDVIYDPNLAPLQFQGYDRSIEGAYLTNNGHTIQFDVPLDIDMRLKSDSLDSIFRLKQFHFHWSHRDDTGSEHVVDFKHYPMEVHFVHVEEESAEQSKEILNDHASVSITRQKNIVVVGVMFNIIEDEDPNVDHKEHVHVCRELEKITDLLQQVEDEGSKVHVTTALKIDNLLPKDKSGYLRYSGSLTTPPCLEIVEWILLTRTLNLTRSQMEKFRSIKHKVSINTKINSTDELLLETEMVLDENVRPLQRLNQREIRLRRDLGDLFPNRRLPPMNGGSENRFPPRFALPFLVQLIFYSLR